MFFVDSATILNYATSELAPFFKQRASLVYIFVD